MFLEKTIHRNAELIKTAIHFHQQRLLPANSYVLDVDTIFKNTQIMAESARRHGLRLFPMTKQIGRNPVIIKVLKTAGADGCVCVDMADARKVHEAGMSVAHLGHLVQIPFAETQIGVNMKPQYWTVFNLEKAKEISAFTEKKDKLNIMLRIYGPDDVFYRGHEGGFPAESVVWAAKQIDSMKGLRFAGITSFPTQLFNAEQQSVTFTRNLFTLLNAKKELEKNGFSDVEINAPGTTSTHMFEKMASMGVTQVEPGHGLTGTTPIHAVKDLEEIPAFVYLSEVSHIHQGRGYCFGGGMYIDPVFPQYDVTACVGRSPHEALQNRVRCEMPKPAAIDYYGILDEHENVSVGDSVVFAFRAQAFVTRAYVVPVSGVASGSPKIEGIFDSDGNLTRWSL